MTSFEKKVLAVCKKIPGGKISTYREIAKAVKKPKAYRAVGNALNKNKKPVIIPCHRVVRADGEIGGYANGVEKKIILLKKEGVNVKNNKINLNRYIYKFN